MGHNKNKNYTTFFNNKKEEIEEVVTEVENIEIPTQGYLEVTDEIAVSEDNTTEVLADESTENPKVEELLVGTVTGCVKLNVRKEPKKDADVLCVIDSGKEVTLDTSSEETYEDFYKICTPAGIEGYCMKKFITIK